MTLYIHVTDGQPVGIPDSRPITVTLPARPALHPDGTPMEGVTLPEAVVGCDHWDDDALREYGWYPVADEEIPETHSLTGYAVDGLLVRAQTVPRPDSELTTIAADRRRAEVLARLMDLDTISTRPLRAITAGTATPEDHARLTALETEASALRIELASLSSLS
ncbi:hypothetical protein [Insolitispirillum peregrinum]|uniref:Uncharacterized protein n=1 Tax=Insolitispirillum peregrinum TaxID=80876 RepID=A0A1N7JK98_9PROT|nr:hypothetical protein [Insolitispirillum peregrinum]SIS49792.1 hypothetical protein SAMN05421779_102351 [Insolitispirillum peregrinum]